MGQQTTNKIVDINKIGEMIAALKAQNKKVVQCHGVFDILHPGHVRHIEAAKKKGDVLVISITKDCYVNKGPERPIFPQELRAEVLAALDNVDYVTINQWPTAVEAIQKIKPSFFVKGSDYSDSSKDITGGILAEKEAVESVGGQLVFTNEITFSSSSLANNAFGVQSPEVSDFIKEFRKSYSENDLKESIDKLQKCKVLVIGDTIIDEYHYCNPIGKSSKENIIVTKYKSEECFAGGVLAAANHVASLCDHVDVLSCLGKQNSYEDFIHSSLKKNVRPVFVYRSDAPTTVKRRFVEPEYTNKLFEICFINDSYLPADVERDVMARLSDIIADYDLVLVTDFGHGLITPRVIDLLCSKARFLAVNAQTNSANRGYNMITKYPRVDYVCIDEPEARLALHDRISSIEEIIKQLAHQLKASHVTITRGSHGCHVYTREKGDYRIPVFTNHVVDTVGAGDAFLSISSPCVAMNVPMEQAGFIGNAAGALKVQIVGNRTAIDKVPLVKFITTLLK